MFPDKTYEMLKEYTSRLLTTQNLKEYRQSGALSESVVFEKENDIFINLHLPEANIASGHLHGHDFFEINYVLKGSCRQNINNTSLIHLEEGSLCIMNPNARHNLTVGSSRDVVLNILMKTSLFNTTFWSLIRQHEYLGQFFLSYFLSQDTFSDFMIYRTENTDTITALLNLICLEYLEQKPYHKTTLRCMLVLFFTEVIRSATIQLNQKQFTDKISVQITALFNYLSINYATATLASTAAYFHYHPNYLSAFIKKNTGKTFRSILNDIKLSQANYFLCNTSMSMNEIAEQLGFLQLCNFYDFIKKNYGMTPVQYRRLHNDF